VTVDRRLAAAFLELHPVEAARVLELLSLEARVAALRVAPGAAGPVLRALPPAMASDTLGALPSAEGVLALDGMPVDEAVALLRRLPAAEADLLVEQLPSGRRDAVRRTLRFPGETAGALMDPDVLAVPDGMSVTEARVRLRRSPRGLLYYLYVVDRDGRLVGVLDLPELMRAPPRTTVGAVMKHPVERIAAWTPAAALRVHPGWRAFHAMPVVDDQDRLLGAIRYQTWRRLDVAAAEGAAAPVGPTVTALGELFHLGLAGFVEGVAAVSGPRVPVERPRGVTDGEAS
jgi:magnesium transporter